MLDGGDGHLPSWTRHRRALGVGTASDPPARSGGGTMDVSRGISADPQAQPYRLLNGRAKIQIEDLLGLVPTGGWVYQAPGQGNPGAEGAHYYYKSQTAEGSNDNVPQDGRFGFQIEVEQSGSYSILLRAARDVSDPGDAR